MSFKRCFKGVHRAKSEETAIYCDQKHFRYYGSHIFLFHDMHEYTKQFYQLLFLSVEEEDRIVSSNRSANR